MEGKLLKLVGAATIASGVLISAPALAQQSGQNSNASGGQTSAMEQRSDEDKGEWGWLGLIGLIGLAGLRRKRHDEDARRNTVRGAM